MNDPKVVIGQLAKRWLSQYGETLGTEEIRRHLSRILSELQKREIEQVFANWSGEELLEAINATFDLDDGGGVVRTKEPVTGLCPPSSAIEPLGDSEYLPLDESNWTTIQATAQTLAEDIPVRRKGGRPPGSKNKGKK
jgi:hypothetical protein